MYSVFIVYRFYDTKQGTLISLRNCKRNTNRAGEVVIFNYTHHFTLLSEMFLIYLRLYSIRQFGELPLVVFIINFNRVTVSLFQQWSGNVIIKVICIQELYRLPISFCPISEYVYDFWIYFSNSYWFHIKRLPETTLTDTSTPHLK